MKNCLIFFHSCSFYVKAALISFRGSSNMAFLMCYTHTLQLDEKVTAIFTVSLYSSALSILWNDSKRAIHHVPKTSCREGNNEAKKKSRDTQVESPIEWPFHLQCAVASPPLLNSFQVFLSSFLPENQQTIFVLFVLMVGGGQFYFPTKFSFLFFCSMLSLQFSAAHSWLFWHLYRDSCPSLLCGFILS